MVKSYELAAFIVRKDQGHLKKARIIHGMQVNVRIFEKV